MSLATARHPEPFSLEGIAVEFDPAGALYLPDSRTLVFSDLHFEKGSSYGRRGLFLPPYDTRRTLDMMTVVIRRWQPRTIISLGDAFHDAGAEARMAGADIARLQALTTAHDWIWILGNHDPAPPKYLAGEAHEQISLGGLDFTHAPCASGNWQVAGHMHPAAKVARAGRSVRRRCFLTDGSRMILPAFGAYTGGLNVRDPAYAPFFSAGIEVMMLGERHVWRVAAAELRPDQ